MAADTNNPECCTPVTEAALSEPAATALADRFKALGDPARLRLLSLIASNGEMCVCDLTEPLGLTQPTVSHHLKVLTLAGMLHREKRGRWVYYSVDQAEVTELAGSPLARALGGTA